MPSISAVDTRCSTSCPLLYPGWMAESLLRSRPAKSSCCELVLSAVLHFEMIPSSRILSASFASPFTSALFAFLMQNSASSALGRFFSPLFGVHKSIACAYVLLQVSLCLLASSCREQVEAASPALLHLHQRSYYSPGTAFGVTKVGGAQYLSRICNQFGSPERRRVTSDGSM